MEGKRKILELDIDTEKILAKSANLQKTLSSLREERKRLKKATGDNSTEIAKNEAKIKSVSGQYRTAQKTLSSLIDRNNKYTSTTEKLNTELEIEAKTRNEAKRQNKELTAIKDELNLKTQEGRDALKQINKKQDENTEFLKSSASQYEKSKINIGNYKESVTQALNENGLFGEKIQGVKQVFQSFSPIINTVKGDVNGIKQEFKDTKKATEGLTVSQRVYNNVNRSTIASLKLLKLALIATGVGAFVVVLGSLISFLATTQKGIDTINKVLNPLKEVFKGLLGVSQELGEGLFNAFNRPKKAFNDFVDSVKSGYDFYVKNVIDPLLAKTENFALQFSKKVKQARIAWNEFTGDDAEAKILKNEIEEIDKRIENNQKTIQAGADNIKKAYKDAGNTIGEFFTDAVERGNEITQLQIEIEKGQIQLTKNEAKLEAQIKEQKKAADDVSKSLEERQAAAEKGEKLAKELTQQQNAQIEKQIRLLKLKNEANDTSRKDLQKIADLEAKRDRKRKKVLEFELNLQNKLNAIKKSEQKEQIKAENEFFEQKLRNKKEELDLFIAQQGIKRQTLKDELKTAKKVEAQKRKILKTRLESGKISETQYQIDLLNLKKEYADKQKNISLQIASEELEERRANIELEVENERQKNLRLREVERANAQKLFEQKVIDKRELETKLDEIEAEFREKEKERQKNADEINKENELAAERLDELQKLERRKQFLEEQRQIEIEQAEKTGADVNLVNKKFNKKQEDLEKQTLNTKLDLTKKTLQDVADLLGKESKAGKAAAVAASLINTYQGITNALASVPFPFNLAAAATTAASGFSAVKKIVSTKEPDTKLASGGMVEGPGTGKSDSIPAMLSNGESVLTAQATKDNRALLSAINVRGGGKPFATGGVAGSTTSAIRSQRNNDLIDYDEISKSFARNLPESTVAVTEIREQSRRRSRVEQMANHD